MQQNIDSTKVAQNLMASWQASGLKEKLIFTFLILALFRLGVQLPVYGIDPQQFTNIVGSAGGQNLLGLLDMFSGGALGKVSIFALGIGPYITSSIIMQLLAVVVPSLERAQKEDGEAGRRKIQQYTRLFAVGLAFFQSTIFALALYKVPSVILPGVEPIMFFVGSIVSLTAGAIIVMWMGELITEKGVGNGASLLIFAGIIAGIPMYIKNTATLVTGGGNAAAFGLIALLAIFFATIILIIVLHEAARKVPIVSARRQVGNKVYGGQNTSIPFKLNPGGVMPIIFAIAILLFPATLMGVIGNEKVAESIPVLTNSIAIFGQQISISDVVKFFADIFNANNPIYYVIYFVLIFGLTFFYASIIPSMQPKEIANNLKKYGSAIPGVKPGKPTADKLNEILNRVMFIGAIALGIIALVPTVASGLTGITTFQGLGSTSLIILVGVALDFVNQIKTHMLAKNYESFLQQ